MVNVTIPTSKFVILTLLVGVCLVEILKEHNKAGAVGTGSSNYYDYADDVDVAENSGVVKTKGRKNVATRKAASQGVFQGFVGRVAKNLDGALAKNKNRNWLRKSGRDTDTRNSPWRKLKQNNPAKCNRYKQCRNLDKIKRQKFRQSKRPSSRKLPLKARPRANEFATNTNNSGRKSFQNPHKMKQKFKRKFGGHKRKFGNRRRLRPQAESASNNFAAYNGPTGKASSANDDVYNSAKKSFQHIKKSFGDHFHFSSPYAQDELNTMMQKLSRKYNIPHKQISRYLNGRFTVDKRKVKLHPFAAKLKQKFIDDLPKPNDETSRRKDVMEIKKLHQMFEKIKPFWIKKEFPQRVKTIRGRQRTRGRDYANRRRF